MDDGMRESFSSAGVPVASEGFFLVSPAVYVCVLRLGRHALFASQKVSHLGKGRRFPSTCQSQQRDSGHAHNYSASSKQNMHIIAITNHERASQEGMVAVWPLRGNLR